MLATRPPKDCPPTAISGPEPDCSRKTGIARSAPPPRGSWTAAASFDGFFELGLGPWDVAAGALLVAEAGGVVSDWSGDGERWLDTGDILAGSPAVHEQLLDIARATGR